MDNLKQDILDSLASGIWPGVRLSCEFRRNLQKRLGAQSASNLEMSAFYYRDLKLNTGQDPVLVENVRYIDKTNPESKLWSELILTLDSNLRLGELEPSQCEINRKALALAMDFSSETSEAFASLLSHVVEVENIGFRTASHPHLFGALILNSKACDPLPERRAISLIHELAHQELFLINMIDRLINAESDYHLVHAPYQGKERPPIGRLHSAYALFRMIPYEKFIGVPELSKHLEQFHKTVDGLLEETTDFGSCVLNAMKLRIEGVITS